MNRSKSTELLEWRDTTPKKFSQLPKRDNPSQAEALVHSWGTFELNPPVNPKFSGMV